MPYVILRSYDIYRSGFVNHIIDPLNSLFLSFLGLTSALAVFTVSGCTTRLDKFYF